MQQEEDDKVDPLVSGYETNLSLFPDDFSSYELEVWSLRDVYYSIFDDNFFQCLPYDFMCDLESSNKVAVNGWTTICA